jgi:hypothetical protein
MPSTLRKPVRIIKRSEQNLIPVQSQTPSPNRQTPVQIRREMVSTIVSWINDRKGTQRDCRRAVLLSTVLCLGLAVIACGGAGQPAAPTVAEPTAELVLRQMSDKLAHAKQVTFKVVREFQTSADEGEIDDVKTEIEVSLSRPDKLMAQSKGARGVRTFYADGQNVSLVDQQMNLYTTIPLGGSIDELVEKIDEKYGFTPPVAEFMLNDPYKKMSGQIQNSSYKGVQVINGVECHHVVAQGELADAELWVAVTDQLPRRLVATFKHRTGSPQLKADFSDWNLNASIDNKVFSFVPAADAEKIEMLAMERRKDDPKIDKKEQK